MASVRFGLVTVYFPTVWDADGAVQQTYYVLNLLVDASVQAGDRPIVGGGACIGVLEWDDLTVLQHVGPIGM